MTTTAKKKISRARKTSTTPTRNWVYGSTVHAPVENREAVENQLLLAHRYREVLVGLYRTRNRELQALIAAEPVAMKYRRFLKAERKIVRLMKAKKKLTRSRKAGNPYSEALKKLHTVMWNRKGYVGTESAYTRRLNEVAKTDAGKEVVAAFTERNKVERKASGLGWGTYLVVEEALKQADNRPDRLVTSMRPNPEYTGEGTLAVQIQIQNVKDNDGNPVLDECGNQVQSGVMGTDRLLSGQDPRARLEIIRDVNKGQHARIHLRIGPSQAVASWPVMLHRPLPTDARFKWIKVMRTRNLARGHNSSRHPDAGMIWKVMFTMESATFNHELRLSGHTAAINLGFRKVGDNTLRIGYLVGTDGHTEELLLEPKPQRELQGKGNRTPMGNQKLTPAGVIESLEYAYNKESQRDQMFALITASVAKYPVPDFLREKLAHVAKWRSKERLHRVYLEWERHEGDEAIYTELQEWHHADKHAGQHASGNREKAILRRREQYRLLGVRLAARGYSRVIVNTPQGQNKQSRSLLETPQRKQQNHAAVWSLVQAVKLSAGNRGVTVDISEAEVSTRHYVCGNALEGDAATKVNLQCPHCKIDVDQDANSAQNLLALAQVDSQAAE